jgi:hypothetical protein
MTLQQAVKFLECLRASNITARGEWVRASCPLAPWLHQSRHDTSPSFGLVVKQGKRAAFHCFACQSGSAEELVQMIELYTAKVDSSGYNFNLAHSILVDEEVGLAAFAGHDIAPDPLQSFQEWPLYWLESFKAVQFHAPAWEYLMGRNVSEATATRHKLRFDSHRQMIVCPYFTVYGKFAGARGRSILPEATGIRKHYEYSYKDVNNARLVWYNEQALDLPGPVVVVEGQFDCWRVEQTWPKVVGNLTARPTKEKLAKLCQSGIVVQIPDNDATGAMSEAAYQEMMKGMGVSLRTIHLPAGVKDPDECHPDFLRDVIIDAVS